MANGQHGIALQVRFNVVIEEMRIIDEILALSKIPQTNAARAAFIKRLVKDAIGGLAADDPIPVELALSREGERCMQPFTITHTST